MDTNEEGANKVVVSKSKKKKKKGFSRFILILIWLDMTWYHENPVQESSFFFLQSCKWLSMEEVGYHCYT